MNEKLYEEINDVVLKITNTNNILEILSILYLYSSLPIKPSKNTNLPQEYADIFYNYDDKFFDYLCHQKSYISKYEGAYYIINDGINFLFDNILIY